MPCVVNHVYRAESAARNGRYNFQPRRVLYDCRIPLPAVHKVCDLYGQALSNAASRMIEREIINR